MIKRNAIKIMVLHCFVYVEERVSVVVRVSLTKNLNFIILLSNNMEHSQISKYWFNITYHGEIIVSVYIGY